MCQARVLNWTVVRCHGFALRIFRIMTAVRGSLGSRGGVTRDEEGIRGAEQLVDVITEVTEPLEHGAK
jgi:hypothetical protein